MEEIIRHYEESEKVFDAETVGNIIFQGWTTDGEPEKSEKPLENPMG